MKINRTKNSEPESVSVIAAGTTITGKIESHETIRVEGYFIGDIDSTGTVITTADSKIKGNVRANAIIVGGNINGALAGLNSITIQSTGNVEGSIHSDTIEIEKGGLFEGECMMHQKEAEIIEMGPKLLEKQA